MDGTASTQRQCARPASSTRASADKGSIRQSRRIRINGRANMSNVVVTGGYGFIGSHLVSALLDRGDSVTVFDFEKNTRDTSIDFDRRPNFRFVAGDVTDLAALEKALTPGVDTVFHLAAVVGVGNYERPAAGS